MLDTSYFENFPILQTTHLKLRALVERDLDAFMPIAFYDGQQAASKQIALKILKQVAADYEKKECMNWALVLEGNVIGTCGFYRGFELGRGEIGYVLNERYRGNGYMGEAVEAIVAFGLNKLGLKEVVAYTSLDNYSSINVLTKAGFEKTGDFLKDLVKFKFKG